MVVSRHWRHDLEPFPELWRDITATIGWVTLRTPKDLKTMLRRADNRPRSLALRCWSSESEGAQLTALLTPHIAHLTSLTIEMPALEGTLWSDVLCAPAPLLERLSVSTSADQAHKLPQNLLGGDAPRLRELVLSNVSIPADPCPVLASVTTLRLLKVKFLGVADLNVVFSQCRALAHLLIDANSGDAGDTTALTIVPHLLSLRITTFIWPGPLDLLVRSMRPDGRLYVAWPRPVHCEEVIAQLQRPRWDALVVRWMRQAVAFSNIAPALELSAHAEDGAVRAVLFVSTERALRQLHAGRPRLELLRSLVIPDDIWLRVLDPLALPCFAKLETLTLHLAPQAGQASPGSYTHLFVLQEPPIAVICPALLEVRLVRDPLRAPKCDFVRVGAVYIAQWLPPTVTTLVLQGVKLIEPGLDRLPAHLRSVEPSPGTDVDAAQEETEQWLWSFPFDDAVRTN